MRQKHFGMAAAALIASVAPASANTITQTASFGLSQTDWTDALSFNGFDPSLGVLLGVTILAGEHTKGTLTNRNNSSTSPATITSTIINAWTAVLPGPLDGLSDLSASTRSDADINVLGIKSTGATLTVIGSSTDAAGLQPGQTLAPYEEPFSIDVTDDGSITVSATNGNGAALYKDFGKVDIQVIYTYTAITPPGGGVVVSEPVSIALLGSGLLGIGLTSRRRNVSADHSNLPR